MKYAQSFDKDALRIKDDKGNASAFAYVKPISEQQAIDSLRSEQNAAKVASVGALSLLCHILDDKRLDGYRGKIALGEKLPAELKTAVRELEVSYLQPLFFAYYDEKNAADKEKADYIAARAMQWDEFIGHQRANGSWSNAKSYATQYLAYFGKLPCAYNKANKPMKDKMLPVAALAKLIANAKTDLEKPKDAGIAGELLTLASTLRNRTDKTILGDCPTAIASLKAMLELYEAVYSEELERMTAATGGAVHPDIAKMADEATKQAKRVKGAKSEAKAAA
jgi:hypothetical protein